jgi:zinc transport system substrate-binding protein
MKILINRILLKPKPLLLLATVFLLSNLAFASDKKLSAFVTVAPQAGILKALAGDLLDISILVTGSCPETFSPSAKQIKKLSSADVFFTLSLPFEDLWVKKTSLGSDKVKPMGKGIRLRDVENFELIKGSTPCDCGKDHSYKDKNHEANKHHHHKTHSGSHVHGAKDPHIWMSIKNNIKMAENSYDVLVKLMPEHKKDLKKKLEDHKKKMKALDSELKKHFKVQKDKNLFVFHPVFGYLADDYGLKQIPIQLEGKEPTAKQLSQIIDIIKEKGAKIIFTQPEFSDKTARTIAKQTNTNVVPISIYNEDVSVTIKDLLDKWKTE